MLTVPTENDLVELSQQLAKTGIRHKRFNEADLGDEFTALATEPINGQKRRVFAKMPLLK